ncbi:S8 family serine peptidase [Hymenobacter algoricola]|uniref:T9SS C-terminal target domain-containing protein n=1 Tax=Hymenobacter algoricola TaxID=486267 RepID=A0ABP7NDJ6_9BACT
MHYFATILRRYATLAAVVGGAFLLGTPSATFAQSGRANDRKIAPTLLPQAGRSHRQTVRVSVTSNEVFVGWARQHLPAITLTAGAVGGTQYFLLENLSQEQVQQLAAAPSVQFVDVPNRQAHEERQIGGSNLAANRVAALHKQLPNVAGQGMAISIKEGPFDPADLDLKGRVLNAATIPGPPTDHATTMATLAAGAGNTGPTGKGVAWQAKVGFSSFAQLLPDNGETLRQAGISVQNHSYGVGIENFYGLESRAYDQQSAQFPALLHVFSSGNGGAQASPDGPYKGLPGVANTTGQFKMSKNTLSVGATNAAGEVSPLSSRGPAYDGRLKPELVAYGDGGTSDAAALVSGISALVQQAYREPRGGTLPPAALVKAILLNSADDTGRPGPDFVSGFGQADALGAVETVQASRFFTGTATTAASLRFPIVVPAGTYLLKATLAWADPAAAAGAPTALLNDLDLELVNAATGQRWRPWVLSSYPHLDSLALPARRRADHLNNVEQVTLTAPPAGTYELHVRGLSLPAGPQDFSLAYELESGLTWVQPTGGANFRPQENQLLHWQWRGPATLARLEYQPLGSSTWRLLKADLNLSQEYYAWSVPDTLTLARLRLVTGGAAFASETFAILPRLQVQVGYVCPSQTAPTEALLAWNALPGVQQYQVYQLRGAYLEPLLQTADTTLLLTAARLAVRHYAVAPVLGGQPQEASRTVDYAENGVGCYIRSFLPREVATDTVRLDLTLGSSYLLQSATLEKLGADGSYVPVQTVAPVTALQLTFTDASPSQGLNTYRVHLLTTGGSSFYSQPESVQYVPTTALQLYPNPIVAGQPLQVIQGEGGVLHMQLYDMLGRLIRAVTEESQIKQFDTSGLKKGLYILRARTASGHSVSRRVVIL